MLHFHVSTHLKMASRDCSPSSNGRTCLCSPTSHPGSFRCSFHRGSVSPAPTPKTNRILDPTKALVMKLIKPKIHGVQRRSNFEAKPTRFSTINHINSTAHHNQLLVSWIFYFVNNYSFLGFFIGGYVNTFLCIMLDGWI